MVPADLMFMLCVSMLANMNLTSAFQAPTIISAARGSQFGKTPESAQHDDFYHSRQVLGFDNLIKSQETYRTTSTRLFLSRLPDNLDTNESKTHNIANASIFGIVSVLYWYLLGMCQYGLMLEVERHSFP